MSDEYEFSISPEKPKKQVKARGKRQLSSDDSFSPERSKKQAKRPAKQTKPREELAVRKVVVSSDSPGYPPPKHRRNILDVPTRRVVPTEPSRPALVSRPAAPLIHRPLPLRSTKFEKSSSDTDDENFESSEIIDDEEEDE
jgi:hypothetical protein